jgi:hypothetical protein
MKPLAILGSSMERQEIVQLIDQRNDEKIGASVAHHFGLMKEYFDEKFKAMYELILATNEKMDRGFAEVRSDISGIKFDVATLKIDVGTLKEDVSVLKKDVAILKTDVKKTRSTS